ncbi:ALG3 protein [Sarocladium implicatum]|nr:ALG3 protein [Sarocladium implicatum]
MPDQEPQGLARAYHQVLDIANGRHQLSYLVPVALWLFDAVLCQVIIFKVPYTEIDWKAYMEQVAQVVSGERDYAKIEGGTGPLVYPAAHVYIYTGLYYLTDKGTNIFLAQEIFAALYLITLAVVMLCYKQAKVPPYVYPLLVLSKRLHSIFMLRCFNDCFATLFLWLSIFFFQSRLWTIGAVLYSWGLGIKMSLLLVLPAVVVILFLGKGVDRLPNIAWLMFQVQLAIGLPFFATNWRSYVGRAFELSRQFKFEWTVNWRMLDEETFLSREFSLALLGMHVAVLLIFTVARWLRPANKSLSGLLGPIWDFETPFTKLEQLQLTSRVTPRFVMATMLSANVIGLLFARSLHYQFYAYLAWATPFLLWYGSPSPILIVPVWLAQEWAWNVFPSTDASSAIVVNCMAIMVLAAYFGEGKREDPGLLEVETHAKTK